LQTFPYKRDELMLVVPDSHPLASRASAAFAETLEYDYVSLPPSTSLASLLAAECAKLDTPMKLRIQVRSFDAICRMVVATRGIGVLPRIAAEPHARSMQLRLIPLTDDWTRRWLLLGVRDVETLTLASRMLLAQLRAVR
jgi:DNA-binding transcriptional LysR family regulator